MKVKFVADAELKHGDGTVEFSAKAGDILDLADDVAQRWMKRNKCVLYTQVDEMVDLDLEIAKEEEEKKAEDEPLVEPKPKAKK
jgi:hypothetical protein